MAAPERPQVTPLHDLHAELGGKLVPFAGWELPISYEGVIAEHNWCRSAAALFDVSHMAVVDLRSADGVESVIDWVETLTPASIATLEPGRQRYGVLSTDDGGIIDDLIVTHRGDHLMAVVNAARRHADLARLNATAPAAGVTVAERTDTSLLALQGPTAVDALTRVCPAAPDLVFLDFVVTTVAVDGGDPVEVGLSRSGYTGGDGFELVVAADAVERVARALLAQPEVRPAGLGARDTLRLEAGLPLYGNDLDETTSPIEAGLAFTVPKRRRIDGRFPGAERIVAEFDNGPARRRVGLAPTGRRPVRDGAELRTPDGTAAGIVTSGGFGPTVDRPISMGYVTTALAEPGTALVADVRGNDVEVTVADLPFVPHRYHRGS